MSFQTSLTELQNQLNNLQVAFLQSQKNQIPITAKTDETANGLKQADTNIEQNTVDITQNTSDIEKNTADIDYIAMMAEIDIPIEDMNEEELPAEGE